MTNTPTASPRPRRTGRIAGLIVLILVLLGAGIYLAGYAMAGDRLPRHATVAGIDIGGLGRDEAVAKLQADYAGQTNEPFQVSVEGQQHVILPADAGLSVDYAKTVESGGIGKSFAPSHIWRVLTGGGDVPPVTRVDSNKMSEAVGALATTVNKGPKDATVSFEGAEIRRTPGENAIELEQDDLARQLEDNYLKQPQVEAKVRSTEPAITDADADQLVEEYAKPALSGPIKVDTGQGVFEVTPEMIGRSTIVEAKDGKLQARTDGEKLYTQAKKAIKNLGFKQAKDASYTRENGGFTVVPSAEGAELTQENFVKVVLPVVTKTGEERNVKAEITPAKPDFTTEQAQAQVPKEVIGEFTTYYPHAAYRNTNLGLAARRITGHTVAPGQIFSLDEALGDRSSYVSGYVVSGGRLKKESGGGISQSATTTFNAGWFAGLEDVEHQPHTLYFDRYPAGREATIYQGHIDMRFRNTTDNAIYIAASNSPSSSGKKGSITVQIYGTKKWDIESPTPTKSGFYRGRTRTDSSAGCEPQAAAPGFTASYYRLFKQNGEVIKREDKSWKYSAADEVKCTG